MTATWADGPAALQAVAGPVIGMLVCALIVMAATAWYRVVKGKRDDD